MEFKVGFELPNNGHPRYRLVQRISPRSDGGGGAMGIVWKAKDLHRSKDDLDSFVVLKFHPYNAGAREINFFDREAKILVQLFGHPNILSVLDIDKYVDSESGQEFRFIVTEHCDDDLSDLACEGPRNDINFLLNIAIDTCRGIKYAHDKGLVHRDIKPPNLFWALDRRSVKVGDFGIAKDKAQPPSLEGTVPHGGTMPYKAPDKYSPPPTQPTFDEERLDDIYSLGVTFYEFMTGKRPFPQGHYDPDESVGDLCEANPEVPSAVSSLISQMLRYERRERPSSVGEIIRVLEAESNKRELSSYAKRNLVYHIRTLQEVRIELKEQIARLIAFFAAGNGMGGSPLSPVGDEEPDWYATVLMRPRQHGRLEDRFYPIYFAHLVENQIKHTSDWTDTPRLVDRPITLEECCSGLPVLWFRDKALWRANRQIPSRLVADVELDPADSPPTEVVCRDSADQRNMLLHMILRGVDSARFSENTPPDNLIKQHYATDHDRHGGSQPNDKPCRGIGWHFKTESGEDHLMRQDIKTEILIPIYRPAGEEYRRSDGDVVGVANFEWVQALSHEREKEICRVLDRWTHEEHRFALSSFVGEILRLVTEYSAGSASGGG